MEAEASITGLGPTKDARVSKDSNIIAAIPPERGFRACIECRRLLESRLDETPKSQSSTGQSPGREQGSDQSIATSPSYSGSVGTCRDDAEQDAIVALGCTSANSTSHCLEPRADRKVEIEARGAGERTEKNLYRTEIPTEVATELVNLYFDKIQAWLPLLHRPNFFARYIVDGSFHKERLLQVSLEEGLLLYGIFALAARHSNNEYFQGLSPPNRGDNFAEWAIQYYGRLRSSDSETTLEYLQGCVLLAFYLYTAGPSHQAWILTGVCVRLAYDLDVCCMDEEDGGNEMASTKWSAEEERRRAFWLIWEIDTFASILSMRPRGLNSQRIIVRLPVSDEAWFSNNPCESPVIPLNPTQVWRVLLDSPNKDERAWFLVANYLMALAYEAASGQQKSQREYSDLASSITYFSLAVSRRYGLETKPPVFTARTFANANWIIGMHLMLANTQACLQVLTATPASGVATIGDDYSRILNRWHPEYIAFSHPFFAGTLLSARTYPSTSSSRSLSSSCNQELSALILSHFATFWELGSVLLGEYIRFYIETIYSL
ncbi:hypothetical protein CMEL01_09198 [Colletotrichum melonis]|uniref:Xylanolytic transcriptional activator regulatory domain-containing protein n=1 Tax=Colletotrichum melonis TaxID=1209925 RepID=A0AAI9XH41_9PEZI|nr:hypothetical protein CMEL01_09198 [Colletotrichum melonis]